MKNRKAAFTLAEVLITLGIIGVVAAMTLPTLIQSYQKQVWATSAKKSYAVISNMLQKMMADEGASSITDTTLFTDGLCSTSSSCEDAYGNPSVLKNTIPKYLKVVKICKGSECNMKYNNAEIVDSKFKPSSYKYNISGFFSNVSGNSIYGFYTNDGQIYYITFNGWVDENDRSVKFCFDTNGEKGPNTRGRDFFCAEYCKNGRIPLYSAYAGCMHTDEELAQFGVPQYLFIHLMNNGWKMDY